MRFVPEWAQFGLAPGVIQQAAFLGAVRNQGTGYVEQPYDQLEIPPWCKFDLEGVLSLVDAWGARSAVDIVCTSITAPMFLRELLRFWWEEEAQLTSKHTLSLSLHEEQYQEALQQILTWSLVASGSGQKFWDVSRLQDVSPDQQRDIARIIDNGEMALVDCNCTAGVLYTRTFPGTSSLHSISIIDDFLPATTDLILLCVPYPGLKATFTKIMLVFQHFIAIASDPARAGLSEGVVWPLRGVSLGRGNVQQDLGRILLHVKDVVDGQEYNTALNHTVGLNERYHAVPRYMDLPHAIASQIEKYAYQEVYLQGVDAFSVTLGGVFEVVDVKKALDSAMFPLCIFQVFGYAAVEEIRYMRVGREHHKKKKKNKSSDKRVFNLESNPGSKE
ncbi:uncharacterized protein BT62DRAFT_924504 [Guyanagaster necrorhizus]|uniref:Uncharacterized protein n=1 Tax=Guyanagaster necrorhizus TaxID=856835 RepID=A0A9P7VFQ0_9AGAR|nr:uncharacterized protein BT62DRAFT_924504 [Guyanagaster necrorhizus MCA 3950]KAG7439733.1 hypothetical protein BT62DRAFT_924504 [Guyanagaster necrorhizus MCA 3950]